MLKVNYPNKMDHAKCEGMKTVPENGHKSNNFVLKALLPLERSDVTILT